MSETTIMLKNEAKYLGVTLDEKLKFTTHIKNAKNKANAALSQLYPLINRKSKLSLHNKLIIYKMIFKPILLYAAPIWSNTLKYNLNSLEIFQNKIIRMITNAERFESNQKIREKLKLTTIKEEIIKSATKFYKIQIKQNTLLNDVATYNKETAPFKIKHRLPHYVIMK